MANTNPIITNNRTIGAGTGAVLLLTLLWGGALAVLAVRPFAAEVLAWHSAAPAFEPDKLAQQASQLDRALALSPSPALAQRAALTRLQLSETYGRQSVWGRREAESALSLARTSLNAAPGNPFLWLWVSQLDAQLNGISPRSAQAWLASVRSGPFDPDLAEDRLWLGLMQAKAFDESERAALAEQVKSLSNWRMEVVVAAALRADSTAIIRKLLVDDPSRLTDFNARVARYPQ